MNKYGKYIVFGSITAICSLVLFFGIKFNNAYTDPSKAFESSQAQYQDNSEHIKQMRNAPLEDIAAQQNESADLAPMPNELLEKTNLPNNDIEPIASNDLKNNAAPLAQSQQQSAPLPEASMQLEAEPQAEIAPPVPQTMEQAENAPIEEAEAPPIKEAEAPPVEFKQNGDIVALTFLGIDTNTDRAKKKMGYRSDTMIVCAINMKDKTCHAITVPRDTRVKIQRLNAKGNVSSEQYDKINAAYAYGGGVKKHSAKNALNALSDLLGVKLAYFVSLDMDAIVPLSDAIGGVEIVLDTTIEGVGKKGQTVNLKGEKAYLFVRQRKGITGGSDLARTKRQQQFVKAYAQKAKQLNPLELFPKMLVTMSGKINTNLSAEQILALGSVLSQMDTSKITFETIKGSGKTINGTSYFMPDKKAVKSTVQKAFS